MANCRVMGKSWADDVTLTATSAALPVANLQQTDVRKVWRSTSTSDQNIDMDFGASRSPTWLYLENLNNKGSMAIDVVMSNASDFTSPTYTSTAALFDHPLPYWSAFHWFDTAAGRYLRITIKEAGNSDGYLECGRIKVGTYFDGPNSRNVVVGPEFQARERGALIETRGGNFYSQQKQIAREVAVTWQYAHDSDNWTIDANSFAELITETGQRDDMLISVYPEEDSDREHRHTVLGRMIANNGIRGNTLIQTPSGIVLYSSISITVRQSL